MCKRLVSSRKAGVCRTPRIDLVPSPTHLDQKVSCAIQNRRFLHELCPQHFPAQVLIEALQVQCRLPSALRIQKAVQLGQNGKSVLQLCRSLLDIAAAERFSRSRQIAGESVIKRYHKADSGSLLGGSSSIGKGGRSESHVLVLP